MRKILIILIIFSAIIACNSKENNIQKENITKIDSSNIRKNEAKIILNKANSWMEKAVKKEISKAKANKEINPLMEKYQELLKRMNKQDSSEIQNYRIRKINELINLQIQNN
jgi:site-specific recombinase